MFCTRKFFVYRVILTLRCREERCPCTPLCVGSDNSGNSPQMAAPRRSREIDQSTQRFHVGCDIRCLLGNEYGGLHGHEFLGRTLILFYWVMARETPPKTVQELVELPSSNLLCHLQWCSHLYFDAKSCRCNWEPIRCGDTKCLVLLCALCCQLRRDININTNRGRVLGKVSCTKNLPLGE